MIPRAWWATSGRLALSDDGDLWKRHKAGHLWLGPIDEADPPAGQEKHFERLLARWQLADEATDEQRRIRADRHRQLT